MKKFILLALAVAVFFTLAGVAYATTTGNNERSTWNPPGPTYRIPGVGSAQTRGAVDGEWDASEGSPHQGYGTGTNKCEVCHSPHQAGQTGQLTSRKLLYGTTSGSGASAACFYCHTQGNLAIAQVYRETTTLAGHDLESGQMPDTSMWASGTAAVLDCASCHTVHGARAIEINGNKDYILKRQPSFGGVNSSITVSLSWTATDTAETAFCGACHDLNTDTTYDKDSHVMTDTAVNGSVRAVADVNANSSDCNDCHSHGRSTGLTTGDKWPHEATSVVGLGTGDNAALITTQTTMDNHCLKCHGGIGTTY